MQTKERRRAHVWVSGRVQGVAFRAFAQDAAVRAGLCGGVRNLADGRVEVEVEGPASVVESYVERLRAGPPAARVENVEVRWESPTGREHDFRIWY
jgi:acylphosphatase